MNRPSSDAIDFEYLNSLMCTLGQSENLSSRSAKSRAKIVSGARMVFLERGYHGVTTYEIADAAGVTQSLIAYHFKTKDGIWQAAMNSLFASFRNGLAMRLNELKGHTDLEILVRFIAYLSHALAKTPSLLRVMTEAGNMNEEHRIWLIEQHVKPTYEVSCHLLEVGKRKGILRDLPVPNIYYLLLTAGSVFALKDEIASVTGLDTDSSSFESDHLRCLLAMLLTESAFAETLSDGGIPAKARTLP